MIRKNSLSYRIVKRVLVITVSLFILSLSGYYLFTRQMIQKGARDNAIHLAGKLSGEIEQYLKPLEKIPEMLAESIAMGAFPKDSLLPVLERILEKNPGIYGAAIAYDPSVLTDRDYFMSFAYRSATHIEKAVLGGETYEYDLMDWYQIPYLTESEYWSEPYYDEGGGNALMTTYSVPFYTQIDGKPILSGIATIDVDLAWLKEIITAVRIFESGYAFVLSRNGVALTHPDEQMVMNESIFSNAENWNEPLLREIGRDLHQGISRFREYHLKGKEKRWIYYTPLSSGSWSLAVVYPESEMYASLSKLNLFLILFVVAGLLILVFSLYNIVSRMARPLGVLSDAAKMVAEGQFDTPLPEINSRDELLELRNSFGFMQKKLAEYIANLKETTAAKEKIESELRVAREIQMSMIPKSFPPFPDLPEIDLYADLRPAKEVGGDLYDFFQMSPRKFCFAIGDVSGKGVPASLFMAVTRTLLRSVAGKYSDPSSILYHLNHSLSTDNESCMFVTFFLGIIDLEKGGLSWVNAGHNPPVFIPHQADANFLINDIAIPLGVKDGYVFQEHFMQLHTGDKIVLYTDGLSEAENEDHQLFGDEAVLQFVRTHANQPPRQMMLSLMEELEKHVKDFPPSDDLTLMTIHYNG